MALTNAENPYAPQPDPSGAMIQNIPQDADMIHSHSPSFGGEIAWNDVQQIAAMNTMIRRANRQLARRVLTITEFDEYKLAEDDYYFNGKLPYIRTLDPSGYPQQGYNIHTHKNNFDGGYLAGAGNHDHRGAGYGGFAFAVYHPGTEIPLRSYRIED